MTKKPVCGLDLVKFRWDWDYDKTPEENIEAYREAYRAVYGEYPPPPSKDDEEDAESALPPPILTYTSRSSHLNTRRTTTLHRESRCRLKTFRLSRRRRT